MSQEQQIASEVADAEGAQGSTWLDAVSFIAEHRRSLSAWALTVGALVAVISLLQPAQYAAGAAFVTDGSARSGIASLAGQFGVTIPTSNRSDSPEFYADLVRSTTLLGAVADDTLTVDELGGQRRAVIDLFETKGGSVARSREATVKLLRDIVSTTVVRTTGVIRLSVVTPWASVSERISNQLLASANAFNVQSRKSQANEERRFIESRLAVAKEGLKAAENQLESFVLGNRQYATSPQLVLDYERLRRDVTLQQQLYTSLAVSYEEVRAREVRDTPVITIIEQVERPAAPIPKRIPLRIALGMIFGFVAGTLVIRMVAILDLLAATGDARAISMLRWLRILRLAGAPHVA